MALRLITDATTEYLDLDDIKHHLRLSTASTVEDALLNSYIKAARYYAENYCKRAFGQQTWLLTLDAFPSSGIELARPPLSTALTDLSITYVDSSGASQTLGTTVYTVDHYSEPGRITTAYENDWPDNVRDQKNAVQITFKTGYLSSVVPDDVKHWTRLRVAQMYEQREPVVVGEGFSNLRRDYVDGLLDRHRVLIQL
jgi:uncharacterized phiE125 gp8 family phage protein